MSFEEIASVTGKGGLFRVLKPAKSGLILESMDESKSRMVATSTHKVSLLNEISIYTQTKEGTVPLEEVLKKMHSEFGDDLGLDANAEPNELRAFMKSVLPEYDEERVYISDIKKLVKWYSVLLKHSPDLLKQTEKAKSKKSEKKEEKED